MMTDLIGDPVSINFYTKEELQKIVIIAKDLSVTFVFFLTGKVDIFFYTPLTHLYILYGHVL